MKRGKKGAFLERIKEVPNVSEACQFLGISRNTIYRWRREDAEFDKELEEALEIGVASMNDLAEHKLISYMNGVMSVDKNGNEYLDHRLSLRALMYWLDNHKPDYIRPRAKDFWQRFFPNDIVPPITAINILPIDPKLFADPARQGQLGVRLYKEALEHMEDGQAQEDKDEPKESN